MELRGTFMLFVTIIAKCGNVIPVQSVISLPQRHRGLLRRLLPSKMCADILDSNHVKPRFNSLYLYL